MGNRERDAFERAVEALARRERTSAELAAWLAERGFAEPEVAAAVAWLIEIGGLDDERFARRYTEDKRELAGWGAERIRKGLLARGLDRDLIEAALAASDGNGASDGAPGDARQAELERALTLLTRRGEAPMDEPGRARALAFLARRGYELEIAYEAVRRFEHAGPCAGGG